MTPFERNARDRLLERRERLLRRLSDEALRIRAAAAAGEVGGAWVQDQALTSTELSGVDHALVRLILGTFGTCERCGRALGTQRLRADPEARFCLACTDAGWAVGRAGGTDRAITHPAEQEFEEDAMAGSSKSGTMLEGHHARLERLFTDLVAEAKKDDRRKLRDMWSEFDRGLRAHIAAEEADLLPGFAREFPAEAARIRRDHTFFENTLTEFGVNLDLHLLREQAVEDFGNRLRLHAETEDHGLYPWAERTLGDRERARIRTHLEGQKG